MKKILAFIRDRHAELYKASLFILSIVIIVYLFPRQGKFKYDFYTLKNKPWSYEDLVAPFDFAIKKTTDELSKEREEAVDNAKPYFVYSSDVYVDKIAAYRKEFNEKWEKEKPSGYKEYHYNYGKKILDDIYKKGILQPGEAMEGKYKNYSIIVVKNNLAEEKEIGDFYSVQSADEYIQAALKADKKVNYNFLLPVLENGISHNVFYNKEISENVLKQAIDDISLTRDVIMKDQIIISRGEIVDFDKFQKLESLKDKFEEQIGGGAGYFFISLGHTVIVILCLLMLVLFIAIFRKDIFIDNTRMLFLLLLITLIVAMASLTAQFEKLSIYALPFCILPIIIRAFYDTRLALFVHIITVLLASFFAPNRFEFVFIELAAGIVAIFSIVNMRNRSQVFISSGVIFLTYSVACFGLNVVQEGSVAAINWPAYAWFGLSAGLTLFSFPLIFIFEKLFGFMSDVSLMELSDTNNPLLRDLASKAPGTFQHSLQVSNLVEEVMYKIGGNVLLARTGALYHDIGKMDIPMYFIENQASGINPHEEMGSEESASIIISHVIRGIEKAKKYNIPEEIIDFIRTHHGTNRVEYFYNSYKKEAAEGEIDDKKFKYPGPIPYSKETAVVMIADAVEASSRSLKEYSAEKIDELVERIIEGQVKQKQFVNSNITFRDISLIKKVLRKKLMSIYHVRIEYPR